jgi:hypothetical protein
VTYYRTGVTHWAGQARLGLLVTYILKTPKVVIVIVFETVMTSNDYSFDKKESLVPLYVFHNGGTKAVIIHGFESEIMRPILPCGDDKSEDHSLKYILLAS